MPISIIIPYYNREKFLKKTLLSVNRQTYRPIELILVDNGSDDDSASICKDFYNKYNNDDFQIKLLEEPQKGVCYARNKGSEFATNDYIYFFDSDDVMSPDFVEDVIHEINISLSKYDVIAVRTNLVLSNGSRYTRKSYYKNSIVDQIVMSTLSTQSMILRKDFFDNIGRWNNDIKYWNDWELGIRVMLNKPEIKWIRKKSYHEIICHPNSITGVNFSDRYGMILQAIEHARNITRNEITAQRALTALQIIKSGQIYREHQYELSDNMYRKASLDNYPIPLQKIFYLYCKYIGTGAWWIYRNLLS